MDKRLFEAARKGDVSSLFKLLEEDPLILNDVETASRETPLHVASMLGHLHFVRETLNQNPGFARLVNRKGYSPMHLASANGHVEVIRELLKIDHGTEHELCRRKDRKGRTPLHLAAIRGRVGAMAELISACPDSVHEITNLGETVLHLTVKNENGFEAMRVLIEGLKEGEQLINCKDEEGNSILHIATARKQHQIVGLLLSQPGLDVNAVNSSGLTALDILLKGPKQSNDKEIEETLRVAIGVKADSQIPPERSHNNNNNNNNNNNKIDIGIDIELGQSSSILSNDVEKSNELLREMRRGVESSSRLSNDVEKSNELQREMSRGIVVLAVLIATVTFEVAVNPPGGVWQDGGVDPKFNKFTDDLVRHKPGNAIVGDLSKNSYTWFLVWDSIGFLASMSIIVALMSPATFTGISIGWEYVRLMIWVVITSVHMVFLYGVRMTTDSNVFTKAVVAPFVFFYAVVGVFALSMGRSMVREWWDVAKELWTKKKR